MTVVHEKLLEKVEGQPEKVAVTQPHGMRRM
jgi:hypothetical protein